MPRILLLLVLGFVVWYFWNQSKQLKTLPPEKRRALLWRSLFIGFFGVTMVLVATGRAHWLSAAFAALLPAAKSLFTVGLRAFPLLKFWGNMGGPGLGPKIRTRSLEVKINITNGRMDGTVLHGVHQGKPLSQLNQAQLQELLEQFRRDDKESAMLLNAYMARRFTGFNSSTSNGSEQTAATNRNIDEAEALQILGLEKEASRDDIISAHKRLIQKLHPDRGGNDYLAAKVNSAKDHLLDGK